MTEKYGTPPVHVLAEPYSAQELVDFEQLIFACNSDNGLVVRIARESLGAFLKHHGKQKCDMMMAKLDELHTAQQRPDA